MVTPQPLRPGDRIAIISPATIVDPAYIDGAARLLAAEGYLPVVMPHAKGPASGSFAASDAGRLADLTDALRDPSVRAILCARGGYGCNHLLAHVPPALVAADPKWLIGFSDVSALHALWQSAGVVSLHAPMAKHLTLLPADHYCTRALMRTLSDGLPAETYSPPHPLDRHGEAEGTLVGGNLAVISGLASTPFDPLAVCPGEPLLLFVEDISEAIYAVERMLIRIRLSDGFARVRGIVAGAFTEYRPDRNHPDMETMIARLMADLPDIPLALAFPAGHTDDNLPLPLGARGRLCVTPDGTILAAGNP